MAEASPWSRDAVYLVPRTFPGLYVPRYFTLLPFSRLWTSSRPMCYRTGYVPVVIVCDPGPRVRKDANFIDMNVKTCGDFLLGAA